METPTLVIDSLQQKEPIHGGGGSLGSVISIILIVVLLVVGAFYVWGQRIAERNAQQVQAVPSAQ